MIDYHEGWQASYVKRQDIEETRKRELQLLMYIAGLVGLYTMTLGSEMDHTICELSLSDLEGLQYG